MTKNFKNKKTRGFQKYLHEKVRYEILNRFGYFVTESSEHFAEYVPWFIKPGRNDLIDKYKIPIDEYIDRCRYYEEFWNNIDKNIDLITEEKLKEVMNTPHILWME